MRHSEATVLLDTYNLEELFELNELTTEEVLCFLVEQEYLTLPEVLPIDTPHGD